MAITIRPDAALREQLDAIARAQGQSVNQYLLSLVRSDVARRQRLASAVGLSWRSSDAELADALGEAVSTPLSDIEQAHLPADPTAAVSYVVSRAAHKRRTARAGKPATSPGTKPVASSGTAKQRASAAPAPAKAQTRNVAPAIVLSSAEYGRLLALRAKRAGKPAPDRQPSANTFTVQGDDADAQAIVAARGGK
jgi:hypothetical protein